MPLLLLLPGRESAAPAGDLPPAPGAIAILDPVEDDPSLLASLGAFLARCPWAPLVIVDRSSAVMIKAALPYLGCRSPTTVEPAAYTVREIRRAVAGRPAPSWHALEGYFDLRLGRIACNLVRDAMTLGDDRNTRRRLQRLGLQPPANWRAILRVVAATTDARTENRSRSEAAHLLGIAEVTLADWCRRHFRCRWSALLELGSWEAVLEVAVRSGGQGTALTVGSGQQLVGRGERGC